MIHYTCYSGLYGSAALPRLVPGFLLLLTTLSPRLAASTLLTHIDSTAAPLGVWSYTLFNDEPVTSPNYVFGFSLDVNAPIIVTGIPDGWTVNTDNLSFVFWSNTDLALPYPHDVSPGASLAGFTISSSGAVNGLSTAGLASWNHSLDVPGPLSADSLLNSPTLPSSFVPEPSSGCFIAAAVLTILIGPRLSYLKAIVAMLTTAQMDSSSHKHL